MKTFLLILFFSKTVLLTPDTVTISKEMEFHPNEPLSAITTGASIQIDITNMVPKANIRSSGVVEPGRMIKERIPFNTVRARLISDDGTEILLSESGYAISNDRAWYSLSSRTGVPTDLEFKKVIISSSIELKHVSLYWRNYKH